MGIIILGTSFLALRWNQILTSGSGWATSWAKAKGQKEKEEAAFIGTLKEDALLSENVICS
jgi:hypothetical protein